MRWKLKLLVMFVVTAATWLIEFRHDPTGAKVGLVVVILFAFVPALWQGVKYYRATPEQRAELAAAKQRRDLREAQARDAQPR